MKLYVFDVDGTLIDYNQNLKEETIKTINNLLSKGLAIAIASGRPFNGVKKYLDYFIDGKKYAICSNGARVYTYEGKLLYEKGVPIKLLKNCLEKYDWYLKIGNIFSFYKGKVGYIKEDKWTEIEMRLNDAEGINLSNILDSEDEFVEKIIFACEPENSQLVSENEEIFNGYHAVRSSIFYLDIMDNSVDKVTGIDVLVDYLKLNKEDVFTFGDAMNDFEMIKKYNGVAMGNAVKEIKEVAKYIIDDVNKEGISSFFKK